MQAQGILHLPQVRGFGGLGMALGVVELEVSALRLCSDLGLGV